MVDTPEQPEDAASPQDLDLEAQLDQLLDQLEEVDPETVPADLRKNPPDVPVVAEPVAAEPVAAEPEPVAAESVEPEPEPVVAAPEPDIDMIAAQIAADVAKPEPAAEGSDTSDQAGIDPAEESGDTAEPAGIGKGLDLETIASMASDLLDQQIDSTIEAATDEPEASEPHTLDAPAEAASAVVPEPSVEEVKPEPVAAFSEDDLASQIQGLLDDVQNKGANAISAEDPATEAAEQAPQPVQAEEVAAAAEPQPVPAAEAQPSASEESAPPPATESAEPESAVSIDQIDAMLAESAEQAIEHGPELEAAVPGTDEVLAEEAKAEQEAQALAQAECEAAEKAAEQEPEPTAEPVAATEPQPVQAIGASAADVANELDEDAQPAAVATPDENMAEPIADEPLYEDVTSARAAVVNPKGLKKAEHALRQICGKINRPLNRLSPEMRDTVGYAGVVTTALAFFMVIYGVLF